MKMPGNNRKTLVLGLGNSLIGDDAFGSKVVAQLRSAANVPLPHAELGDAHTDLLGRIDGFSEFECIVLVDAILDPGRKLGPSGSVVLVDEKSMQDWPKDSSGVHRLSPMLAVRLFRSLYPNADTRIFLVGLCIDRLAMPSEDGTGACVLSEEAVACGARMVRELLQPPSKKKGTFRVPRSGFNRPGSREDGMSPFRL
jgi:hydrogenase maturation protease